MNRHINKKDKGIIMKITKETVLRACRTFIQSALAYITVNAMYINFTGDKAGDKSALLGLLIASLSAGIAGAMNLEKEEKGEL